jgi:hypothetical protein
MTNATSYELIERKPACTLAEARQLIDDLKAEYQMLGESERLEVRRALKEVAQALPATEPDGDWE